MSESPPSQPTTLRFGHCELRLDTRTVRLDGEVQPVRKRVFDLIVYLAQKRPRTVTREELLKALWRRREASHSLLARAVGEARRAIGDSTSAPRLIITVHGIGYRFAAAGEDPFAADDAAVAPEAEADAANESAALGALIAQARLAFNERRCEDARRLSDEVMARAKVLGSNSMVVRALLVRGSVELQTGTVEQAARSIGQALRVAQAEGAALLLAEARIAAGGLHVWAGDLDMGVRHLRAAMEALSQPGAEPELMRCLGWLSQALWRQGEFEAALQMCRRCIRLGQQFEALAPFVLSERLNEVNCLRGLGDREAALGKADVARARYDEALALVAALLDDSATPPGGMHRLLGIVYHGTLLERTGNLDAAWAEQQRYGEAVAAHPGAIEQIGHGLRALIDMQQARLLARRGFKQEALALAQGPLDRASAEDLRPQSDEIFSQACLIAEIVGDLEAALRWQRARFDTLVKAQRAKSASLAAILVAETSSESLQEELSQAQAQRDALLRTHAELQARIAQLETAGPVDTRTGLAHAALLPVIFAAAFDRARERELPMCIGFLTLPEAQLPPALQQADAMDPVLRRVAEALSALDDVARPAVRVGHATVVFHIADVGPRHAAAICRKLLARLAHGAPPALEWHCASADAVASGSIEACVQALRSCALPA